MSSLDAERDVEREARLDAGAAGSRFIRGAGLRLIGYLAGLMVGVAVTPFVTRHLGTVGWGRYITVSSIVFITAALVEGGLGNLGVQEFSNAGRERRDEYMSSLLGLRIALSVLGAVGATAFAVIAGYHSVLLVGVAIGCCGLLLSSLQVTLSIALATRLRLGWQAVIDFTTSAGTAAALAALVILHASLVPFFAVSTVVAAITLTLTVSLVRHDVRVRPSFRLRPWRELARQSTIYAAASVLGVVYFQIVAIAVSLMANSIQTGQFDLGFRVVSILNGIPWVLVAGAFPILARAASEDHDRLRAALQQLIEAGVVLGGWISIGMAVGAPFIVTVVGGASFGPSVAVLRILSVGIIATYLLATWSFALLSLRLYRQLIASNAAAVTLAVVLSVILIPWLGANGAAIVTAALEIVLAASYLVSLVRRYPDLAPRNGSLTRIVGSLLVALGTGIAVPLPSIIKVIAATLVLALLLWRTGAINEGTIQALLRRRSPDAG